MDLITKKVLHKMFGKGVISSYRESERDYVSGVKEAYIEVKFEKVGPKKFLYPASFEQFLIFEDKELQNEILKLVKQKKLELQEKRDRDEIVRKFKMEKKKEEEEAKKSKRKKK